MAGELKRKLFLNPQFSGAKGTGHSNTAEAGECPSVKIQLLVLEAMVLVLRGHNSRLLGADVNSRLNNNSGLRPGRPASLGSHWDQAR